MGINQRELKEISNATVEFFTTGKIKTRCPRCGGPLECNVFGKNENSYEIKCIEEDLVLDIGRGI